jgi:SAM-dependent methyltransferase
MDAYRITHQTWDKVAAVYAAGFMDVSEYAATFDAFCGLLPQPGAHVFEIGCGPGNITRYLLTKRPDLRLEGIDVAPSMVALAQANNPTAAFAVLDARAIGTLPTRFDGIMCGFCVPYLAREDVTRLVQDCARLLKRGGVLYLSAIAGEYAASGYESGSTGDQTFVFYYPESDLHEILRRHAFTVLTVTRQPFTRSNGQVLAQLFFIARKG